MIRRPPRSTLSSSSAASDVYKRQVLCALASFWLPAELKWFALLGQGAFYGLALLDPLIPETSALKRATAPVRAFVVLLAAALFAVSIFFVEPERLWKHTKVRKPRAGESPLEPNASR